MRDWNVVVSVYDGRLGQARRLLRRLGPVAPTGFRNVLVLRTDDPVGFLERLEQLAPAAPELHEVVSRAVPATVTFTFQSPEEFEAKAREAALAFLSALTGKSFHVRLHRRGFKGQLQTPEEERFLDRELLAALEATGTPGSISFEDPDAVVCVETVGPRAGLSLWTREDRERYPLLKLD